MRIIMITMTALVIAGCSAKITKPQEVIETARTVRAGQVWVYEGGINNPFETPTIWTNTVLAVSNNYVQYRIESGVFANAVRSESIGYFLVGSRLIQETK